MKTLRRFWAWLNRRSEPRPVAVEVCEVCGQLLAAEDVWELRSDSGVDDGEREELAKLGIAAGGMYMSATYCGDHFPAGRTRWRAAP